MGQGINTIARKIGTKTRFVDISAKIDSTVSFNQGDLLVWDNTNKLVVKAAAEADGATFLGIAPVTIVDGNYPPIYNSDVVAGVPAIPGPEYGDVHRVMLKAGDAVVEGQTLFLDPASGGRFVQTAGTKAVGIYQGKALTAAVGGTEIEMLVGARWPNDTLEF
jgi:hypothetical protein